VPHARCAPPAGGVTDARDRNCYERFTSTASAAGATPAAGSASRRSATSAAWTGAPRAEGHVGISPAWRARTAAHLFPSLGDERFTEPRVIGCGRAAYRFPLLLPTVLLLDGSKVLKRESCQRLFSFVLGCRSDLLQGELRPRSRVVVGKDLQSPASIGGVLVISEDF
jgi:hypothetical protein